MFVISRLVSYSYYHRSHNSNIFIIPNNKNNIVVTVWYHFFFLCILRSHFIYIQHTTMVNRSSITFVLWGFYNMCRNFHSGDRCWWMDKHKTIFLTTGKCYIEECIFFFSCWRMLWQAINIPPKQEASQCWRGTFLIGYYPEMSVSNSLQKMLSLW